MTLTLLVGRAALTLLAVGDSTRPASKPSATTPTAAPTTAAVPAARAEIAPPTRDPFTADSIVVQKSLRRLSLYSGGVLVRSYVVALGQQPVGDKVRRGDMRTPEGLFTIEGRNPKSRYHRALRISYPDAAHRARAAALGVSPGGDIMIHGLPNGQGAVGAEHRAFDWTEGCIAVTNEEIDEIWSAVPIGTRIEIKP